MNIGFIRMRYTPYGGAEVFLSRLIDDLVKRGHKCHIFANEWKNCRNKSVTFHHIKVVKGLSFLKVLSFAVGTYFALRKEPLDVIFSLDRTLHQDIYRAGDGCHKEWLMRRRKILSPLRHLSISLNPLHWTMLLLEKRLFQDKKLKAVIANSQMVKEEIMRHYGLSEDKIHVIHNGLNSEFSNLNEVSELRNEYREKLGISKSLPLILFVGSGFERKGLLYLIKALANLKRRKIKTKLLVVGKGKTKKYERLAKKLHLDKDIIFVGPQKDVKHYYCTSDLFVLPTLYDPFSNATLEAMVCGLPVITSRFNGASEIVEKEGMGCIIDDPTNPEEIGKLIEVLLKAEKEVYVAKGRGIAHNYSIEKTVKVYLKVMEIAQS